MKATYQKPEMLTENVQAQQTLLAGSNRIDTTNNQVKFNYESMDEGSGSDAASKDNSFDFWED